MARNNGSLAWPVTLDPAEEGGFNVNFPDFPEGFTQGDTRDEALAQAVDLLETIVANYMAEGWDLPAPSAAAGRPLVRLAPLVAAKAEVYRAMRAAGVSKAELARRVGVSPQQAQRLFDIHHASRLDQIDAALAALGRRLVVTTAPPPNTKRWVARRKAAVVADVRSGRMTLEEVLRRYKLAEEEYRSWERAIKEPANGV